jgi:hypothetical protein
MHCETFETQLSKLLDERRSLTSDEALLTHAESCERCGPVLDSYCALIDTVERQPALEIDDDLTLRIMAAATNRSWWNSTGMLSASNIVAACVAVAASLLIAVIPQYKPSPSLPVAEVSVRVETKIAATESIPGALTPVTTTAVAEIEQSTTLAAELGLDVEAIASYWPPVDAASPGTSPDPIAVMAAQGQRVVAEIQPFAETMTAAIAALRRTLPQTASAPPPY